MQPLQNRVIIKKIEPENMTAGGIILTAKVEEKFYKGEVIAVGPGTKDEPTTVKIGDIVMFGLHSGAEIDLDGGIHFIMRETEIMAILN